MESPFRLVAPFAADGDQPRAIEELVAGLLRGDRHQVLLGITGSGKTFTMASVIARLGRPALILAHNKTLAAQLYGELKEHFPENAVHYFVSYYDYYQPEAYIPSTDTYIEKDSMINDEIERMRHAATYALLSRPDTIIVASVSCIYGIGEKAAYLAMTLPLRVGARGRRDEILRRLVAMQYERNDYDFHRGAFRVRGDTVEVFPAYEAETALRIEWFGDEIESLTEIDPLRGLTLRRKDELTLFPASHHVVPDDSLKRAAAAIREELRERLGALESEGKLLERQRLSERTLYDLEMLEQTGFVKGIENYSRHLTGRAPGEPPPTLVDYFPKEALFFIDESHQTVPQLRAMFLGDRSRKQTLVEFGFRLPSALDNRPLRFEEWEARLGRAVFVSATPGDWELERAGGVIVEQIIRPTGLVDPPLEVRPVASQVDDLLGEDPGERAGRGERVLVTTLTKRMAEDLTDHYAELGVRVRYLHSDIDTLERVAILRDLRKGEFDVLVGINLLREGLDLPEVSLVAVLDADKEGFLRSTRSLIQTAGRAARNLRGHVILYADSVTPSMRAALDETGRRRLVQERYNREHGITPRGVERRILDLAPKTASPLPLLAAERAGRYEVARVEDLPARVVALRAEMAAASKKLEFERAAKLRDEIRDLERLLVEVG